MKRVFSFLLIIAILCTVTIPCFAANPSVSVKAQNAVVGDTITVSVNLSSNSNLGALEIELQYGSEFAYISGTAKCTDLFEDTIGEIPGICFVSSSPGKIKFSGANPEEVNGAGTLFTAQFKVNKVGGEFSIKVLDAINGDNQKVTVLTSGATVKCSHSNAKCIVTKKATCTEKGSQSRECSCGNKSTQEIAIVAHEFGDWSTIKEATETEKGAKERICKVCSKKETAEIDVIETQTESQSESQSQNKTETTTKASRETSKGDTKLILIGGTLFAIGVVVGGAASFTVAFVITKRKEKEK